MESVVILRRLPLAVLTLAVSLSACRARQDVTEEVYQAEEVAPKTEDSVSNQDAAVAEGARVGEALPDSEPEPTAPPVAREPVPEVAPPSTVPSPPEPKILEVTVPAATVLELELLTPLDTSVSLVGDEIEARTISPLYLKGETILPRGTYVEGRVTEVIASGRVKGRAQLAFTFDRLSTRSGLKEIRTSDVSAQAPSQVKTDAGMIGGAGGTGVVLTTKGKEIRLPVGTEVNVQLDEPIVLQLN